MNRKDTLGRREFHSAEIWPTFDCTFRCPLCSARPGSKTWPNYQLSMDQYVRFLDRVQEQGIAPLGLIDFVGGEPTLWPYLIEAVAMAKLRGSAKTVRVLSNGWNCSARNYGQADIVRITHYGATNRADLLRLRRELGKRLKVSWTVHIPCDILPGPTDLVLPAVCGCVRLNLLGDMIYPCNWSAIRGVDGVSVESDFYDILSRYDHRNRDICRSCVANQKNAVASIPPLTCEFGVWGSPYGKIVSLGIKAMRFRRWMARRYMKKIGLYQGK